MDKFNRTIRDRIIRTIASALLAHMAMDFIIREPWMLFSLTWWTRSMLLAATMVMSTELMHVQEYYNRQ